MGDKIPPKSFTLNLNCNLLLNTPRHKFGIFATAGAGIVRVDRVEVAVMRVGVATLLTWPNPKRISRV